jgi:CheY-like chemotaxis protein
MLAVSPSLLITDDDVDFARTLCDAFQPRGFRTLLARDGEQALGIIRSDEVHLALLDMHMPGLSGVETIRRVKRLKALLPCILMSAQLDPTIVQQARRAQAFSVLRKPMTLIELTTAVQSALAQTYNWPYSQQGES